MVKGKWPWYSGRMKNNTCNLKNILILTLLFALPAHGHIPTLESILRNGFNKDFDQKYLKAKLDFHQIQGGDATGATSTPPKYTTSFYIHYFLTPQGLKSMGTGKDGYQKVLPASWSNPSIDLEIEQRVFFSSLEMIFLNRATSMSDVLKIYYPSFARNNEKKNPRKEGFLSQHLNIMSKFHELHSQKIPIPAALNKQLKDIHNRSMLKQENYFVNPQLEYTYMPGVGIFYKSTLENIEFLFYNQSHRIYQIDMPSAQPKAKFMFHEQTMMSDQGFMWPKEIDIYEDGILKWRINLVRIWTSGTIPNDIELKSHTSNAQMLAPLLPELVTQIP